MSGPAAITAVLVGHEGDPSALLAAVRSLEQQTLAPAEIVCVDQSADQRHARALKGRSRVRILSPGRNLGYPSACNLAAAVAGGDHLLFLNPDARAEPGCVAELAAALMQRPEAAIAGAQVLLPDGRVNAGDNALHISGLSWAGRYGLEAEDGAPRPAAVVSGAAMLVRRRAFESLGGYTEGFFMYYDDVDLAWRARLRGWEVLFCPRARVRHDYEFAKGDYKWLWLERNRWWCLLCHLQARTLVALAPVLAAAEVAVLLRAAREGWLEAKLESYRLLWADRRAIASRRRDVQSSRALGDGAILARMTPRADTPLVGSRSAALAAGVLAAYRRLLLGALR
ncbi:MAG TPA: glycosyltransferase family 2 protein [Solirubrobacteraceae bacterium]|nr:glycosyltransferase family 2 protein [Solirubrobacteraceae bacterium]